jgi:hypothetical protein
MRSRTFWVVLAIALVLLTAGLAFRRGGSGLLSDLVTTVHGGHRR